MPLKPKMINREISWLAFNDRVLQEAADPNVPLIERMHFLGIFSNNMDEFFRVRVASVKRILEVETNARELLGGYKPKKLLKKIQDTAIDLQKRFEIIYHEILHELREKDIFMLHERQLNEEQGKFVKEFFHNKVRSALVPIMVSHIRDFPYLKDKSIYLAVKMMRNGSGNQPEYSLIEVPTDSLPRFVILPSVGRNQYIMLLDDVIRYCLYDIFSIFEYDKIEAYTIKLTRDAELDMDQDLAKSMLEKISRSLKKRKTGEPVRFVHDSTIPKDLLEFLKSKLEIEDADDAVIPGGRYHNFKDFMRFPSVGSKSTYYVPLEPISHKHITAYHSLFPVLKERDIMLHYPYQSFDTFLDLLREAAIDPTVSSIKITLYRLAKRSKVVNALINAARNGKKVVAILELQARFDEEANIFWSNQLMEEGVQVIYGVPGLKVHSKICMISRREEGKRVHYCCIGTGNFNEFTAGLYCDELLMTSHLRITQEIRKVFSFLENHYKVYRYEHLIVSPHYSRPEFKELIEQEIANARTGKEAWMFLKMNSLVDEEMINKLYEASNAGVKIRIIARGICCLIPGVKGMSENIEAISIVDRFLEHSRIYVFANDDEPKYYFGSADWMYRNLNNRVEVTCPIYDKDIQDQLRNIMEIQWNGNVKVRYHDKDLSNTYRPYKRGQKKVRAQMAIYDYLKAYHQQKEQ